MLVLRVQFSLAAIMSETGYLYSIAANKFRSEYRGPQAAGKSKYPGTVAHEMSQRAHDP
jgi:hypothetical protein